MKKVIFYVIGIIILFSIILVLFFFNKYKNSPLYSLMQIEKAIKEKNILKLEKYVNINSLTDQFIDGVINQQLIQGIDNSTNGWEFLGGAIGSKLVESYKPIIKSLLRSSISESISNGIIDSLFNKSDPSKNINLKKLQDAIQIDLSRKSLSYNLKTEGKVGLLEIKIENPLLDTATILKLKLLKIDNYWNICEFENLDNYLITINNLKNEKLRFVNDSIKNIMNSMIQFESFTRKVTEYEFSYSEYLQINYSFKNTSTDTLSGIIIKFDVLYKPDDSDYHCIYSGLLYPGNKGVAKKLIDYNRFTDSHVTLRYANDLMPSLYFIQYLKNGDKKYLYTFDSWEDYITQLDKNK